MLNITTLECYIYIAYHVIFYFYFLKILSILIHTKRDKKILNKLIVMYFQKNLTLGYIITKYITCENAFLIYEKHSLRGYLRG